jgi:hypothetical protein
MSNDTYKIGFTDEQGVWTDSSIISQGNIGEIFDAINIDCMRPPSVSIRLDDLHESWDPEHD